MKNTKPPFHPHLSTMSPVPTPQSPPPMPVVRMPFVNLSTLATFRMLHRQCNVSLWLTRYCAEWCAIVSWKVMKVVGAMLTSMRSVILTTLTVKSMMDW